MLSAPFPVWLHRERAPLLFRVDSCFIFLVYIYIFVVLRGVFRYAGKDFSVVYDFLKQSSNPKA